MQQRNIIIFLIIFFIASSAWLFRASDSFVDPDSGKNWWTVYFSDPKSDNLNFVIENHHDETGFGWKVLDDNQAVREGREAIEKGQSKEISVGDLDLKGRITIQVSLGEEKKEIYKNINKD